MATSKEKFQLVFEAKETASRKIRGLNRELAALGGKRMLESTKTIRKLERQIKSLGGTIVKTGKDAKRGNIMLSRFTQGIALGNIAANAASTAMGLLAKGIGQIGTAVMVAANVEELGGILNFVGQRAGYSSGKLGEYRVELRKSGIAQKESNQALLRAIQGNIKLSDAVKLGRIAQDAATIGQVNSSEAYQTLINAVVKGRVVLLKSLGIQGTFQAEYRKLAKTLGKTQVELTTAEKTQARLNLVMKGGEVIAGAYDTAMGFASKKMRSMDRHVQDLQVSVGQYLTPSFAVLVDELTMLTKGMTTAFTGDSAQGARDLAKSIGEVTASLIVGTKMVFNFGKVGFNVFQTLFIAPIEVVTDSIVALAAILSNPFNKESWSKAGDIVSNLGDIYTTNFDDIEDAINSASMAAINYGVALERLDAQAKAEKDPDAFRAKRVDVPEAIDDMVAPAEEAVEAASKGMVKVSSRATIFVRQMGGQMKASMGQAVNGMISNMVTGRQSMADLFKGIAQDFMIFFIKKALAMIINTFIPGLGSMLGGIFDTPVNDRMAAGQGRDFMKWFTRGALAEAQGGTELAVGITNASNTIVPVGGGGGGGGPVILHVNITGNLLSDGFIEDQVAPKLKELIDDGRSQLSVQNENNTGGRDVLIN